MKTLYFDIDDTIVHDYRCKPALANGAFERAVREAGFERLVCVSNVCEIIKALTFLGKASDELAVALEFCRGTFVDAKWFRQVTTLITDPEHRANMIDYSTDWWYLDDCAADFMEKAGRSDLFNSHEGRRIFVPKPEDDGTDILEWLRKSGSVPAGWS